MCDLAVNDDSAEDSGEAGLCHRCGSAPAAAWLSDLSVSQGDPMCEGCFGEVFGECCPSCAEPWAVAPGSERVPAGFHHPELEGTSLGEVCVSCLGLPLTSAVDVAAAFAAFREAILDPIPDGDSWLEDLIAETEEGES